MLIKFKQIIPPKSNDIPMFVPYNNASGIFLGNRKDMLEYATHTFAQNGIQTMEEMLRIRLRELGSATSALLCEIMPGNHVEEREFRRRTKR